MTKKLNSWDVAMKNGNIQREVNKDIERIQDAINGPRPIPFEGNPNDEKFTIADIIAMDGYGFQKKAKELGELLTRKNFAYGSAANSTGKILEILYPNGVTKDKYQDMLLIVRILDKLSRIATNKDEFDESPFEDIAGYGIIGSKLHGNHGRKR